jgi:hypothetical protein
MIPFALRYDDEWWVPCCDLDILLTPQGATMVPTGWSSYGRGKDSKAVHETVRFTGSNAFTMQSFLQTSYGHDPGVGTSVKTGAYKGVCAPKTACPAVKSCTSNVVTDGALFTINGGSCEGIATSLRKGAPELIVTTDVSQYKTKDGKVDPSKQKEHDKEVDTMHKGGERIQTNRPNSDVTKSTDTSPIQKQPEKITIQGHRSYGDGAGGSAPQDANDYGKILEGLEARGVDLNNVREVEIIGCGADGGPKDTQVLLDDLRLKYPWIQFIGYNRLVRIDEHGIVMPIAREDPLFKLRWTLGLDDMKIGSPALPP